MEEQEIVKKAKWESAVRARVANGSADQIWGLLKDFFGVHKYFPNLSSHGVHGNNGEVGSVRYCEGVDDDDDDDDEKPKVLKWTKEKLIAIDPTQRSLSYEMIDTNTGFNSYVSTMKVLTTTNTMPPPPPPKSDGGGGGGGDGGGGCVLEWSFSVDPVEGFQFQDLVQLYLLWLQFMAQKMESLSADENQLN